MVTYVTVVFTEIRITASTQLIALCKDTEPILFLNEKMKNDVEKCVVLESIMTSKKLRTPIKKVIFDLIKPSFPLGREGKNSFLPSLSFHYRLPNLFQT